MADHYDYLLKVVLIGDSKVGKTSILHRHTDDVFNETFIATIGVDFRVRQLEASNCQVKLQIWDTAGQERFRTITSAYYRGADGVCCIFDVTNRESFEHVEKWLDDLAKHLDVSTVTKVIVGNKSDLHSKRVVQYDEGLALAQKLNLEYVETSAKSSTNIENLFQIAVTGILKRRKEQEEANERAKLEDKKVYMCGIEVPSFMGCLPCASHGDDAQHIELQ